MLLFSVSIKKQKMLAESKIIKAQKRMKGILIAQDFVINTPNILPQFIPVIQTSLTELSNKNKESKKTKKFNHFDLWSKFLTT